MVKTHCEIQSDEIKSVVNKANEEKLNEIKPIIKNAETNNKTICVCFYVKFQHINF
jgi:hypothetical protein